MELLLGFFIAVLIALTGVGAGTMMFPLLTLFLHLPLSLTVGTALAYAAAVKLVVLPVQVARGTIAWRTLGTMLAAGIPGVVLGAILFRGVIRLNADRVWLYLMIGAVVAASSAWHIYRHFRPAPRREAPKPRRWWLAAAIFPLGLEVGFSSCGAGALSAMALLSLTQLEPAEIVGTDLAFGLCLSLIGGGLHLAGGRLDVSLLLRLIAGGVLGAIVGSIFASRIPARAMRLALSLWLLAIGLELCWHARILARS